MRVIPSMDITLLATNITGSSYAEWSDVANYTAGDYVKVTTATPHREYRALQGGVNHPPATSPEYWSDQGATNQYRLLDDSTSTRTTATTSFWTTVQAPGTPTYLCLFGLDNVLTVEVQIQFDGEEVYNQLYALTIQRYTASWWEFFFGSRDYQASILIPIGGYYQGEVTVSFSGDTGATIGVGHLVLGTPLVLGETIFGAQLEMTQYSTKETDDFGNLILVPRDNAKIASVKLYCDDAQIDRIYRTLERLDATAAVWDLNDGGRDLDVLRIWGIADFRILLEDINGTFCELDVKGMI